MWVKICGIRDESTAEQVCQMSPDAIGLNFYARSPRCVERTVAQRIATVTGDQIERVGVFVNHAVSEIEDTVGSCQLHSIQLHGDETVAEISEVARRLPGVPIYRAWRMEGESLGGLAQQLTECTACGIRLAGCLIDSRVPGAYGGTGHAVPWEPLSREYKSDLWPALVLAGGLTADNVATAIRTVRPWGVDVASGVESSPGTKDLNLVRRFIENARTGPVA